MHEHRMRFNGTVVSDKMDKSVVVLVERRVRDKKTGKVINRKKRFIAHDAMNGWKIGESVMIREIRPLSKNKHFIVESRGNER